MDFNRELSMTDEAAADLLLAADWRSTVPVDATQLRVRYGQGRNGKYATDVAVIDLFGLVEHREPTFHPAFSLVEFGQLFRHVVYQRRVDVVILNVDSSGGEVAGTPEAAASVFAARDKTRVIAIANGIMKGAAYWLASAAGQVFATPSGDVGGIGVLYIHEEQSKADAQAGLRRTIIHSADGKSEGNRFEPLSEAAADRLRDFTSARYRMMIDDIARHRGTDAATVEHDYGNGRTLAADQALAARMIDKVKTFDELLAELGVRRLRTPGPAGRGRVGSS